MLFSIVLPTVNRAGMLRDAIDSVLTQTVEDYELIVVDDGSTPPASVPDDPRIVLVRRETNRGPASARNAGLDIATGRFVTFLDDDDWFTSDRLELALEGLERAPIALCWSRFDDETEGTNRMLEGDVADMILDHVTPTVGRTALLRELAEPFDERWQAVEDIEWWLRTARSGSVTTVPRVGYIVRRHDQTRTRNHLAARISESLLLFDVCADYFTEHRAGAAFRWKRIGLMALHLGDRRLARRAFAHSLAMRPTPATASHLARSVGRSTTRVALTPEHNGSPNR